MSSCLSCVCDRVTFALLVYILVFLYIAFEAPAVMTSVLGPTSIRVTFTQPSGTLAAESYDIQYTRVILAGQTLCGSVGGTGATTDVQSPFIISSLEEFSSYDITVTARAFSAMHATTERAMTSPAGVINCLYMTMEQFLLSPVQLQLLLPGI